MKKIFLLLVSAAAISTSFAQYSDNNSDMAVNTTSVNKIDNSNDDYGYGTGDTYTFSMRQKNLQTMSINNYYDQLVQSVKELTVGSADTKDRKISELEAQRLDRLHSLNAKFFDKKNVVSFKKKYVNDIYNNNKYNWNL